MRPTVILAALCAVVLASSADARPKHHHGATSAKIAQVDCSDPAACMGMFISSTSFEARKINTAHASHARTPAFAPLCAGYAVRDRSVRFNRLEQLSPVSAIFHCRQKRRGSAPAKDYEGKLRSEGR